MPQAVAAAAVWVGNAIGTAVGASLTAVGVSASVALPLAATAANVAYFASELALYTGLNYIVNDIATQKPAPSGQELQLRVAADIPREMLIGVRATAGSIVARYSRGSNLYNAHFAIQLADHPCEELSKVYGDGRLIRNTPLTHGVRTEITAYSYSGGPRVWMTWHDGRPGQTVDSDLVSKSALDPDVVSGQVAGWSSTHYGRGCAWVHVEVQYDSDILTSIPQFLFIVKGAKFYDRRLDSTLGGSGSHRLNDPSTWAYSTNAGVITSHYLLGYRVEDDDLAFGVGLEPDEVPYDVFANLATLCDEDVTTGTGGAVEVIKRYAINGIISAAQGFEDVLQLFEIQMAARIVDLGGRIGVLGGDERTAVVTLSDKDWADDEAVRFSDKLQFSDLYGGIVGTFSDPGNLYQPTPYERQTTSYFQLPDGGEATVAQVDMPLEVHPRRCARLASAWLARESLQPRLVGTFATRSLAWKLEPGDWFNMSSDRNGFASQVFEVVDTVKHEDFTVTITARAIDPAFLAFNVADDPDLSIPPAVDPVSLKLTAPTGTIAAILITGGSASEPAIRFTLTDAPAPTREIVVELMEWNGTALVGDPIVATMHSDQGTIVIRNGVLPTKQYKARAKVRLGQRESDWTAYSSPVTASSTYSVPGSSLASAIVGQGALATRNDVAADQISLGTFGENMVLNGGAETGDTSGWAHTGEGASGALVAALDTATNWPKGKYSFKIVNSISAGNAAYCCRAIQVTPGRKYRVRFSYLYGATASSGLYLRAYYAANKPAGGYVTSSVRDGISDFVSNGNPVDGIATDLTFIWTAPAGANWVSLVVYDLTGGAGHLYFDNVELAEVVMLNRDLYREDGSTIITDATVVTGIGISAGITGQGWGATATEPQASNAQIKTPAPNVIRFSMFEPSTTIGWDPVYYNSLPTLSKATTTPASAAHPGLKISHSSGVAGQTYYSAVGIKYSTVHDTAYAIPVKAGDRVQVAAQCIEITGGINQVGIFGVQCDSAGARVAYLTAETCATANTRTTVGRVGGLFTATQDGFIVIDLVTYKASATTSASSATFREILLAKARTDQVDVDPWTPSTGAYSGADVTGSNTSAGIFGQGPFATANYYEQSTDPGAVANGSFWFKTTTNELYIRRSGAWGLIAKISTGISATASPSSVSDVHTGSSFSSGTITITPSGGSTYAYSVTFNKSGGAGNVSLSATNAASFTATSSLASGQDVAGGIIVTIFETTLNVSVTIRIPLNFTRTD